MPIKSANIDFSKSRKEEKPEKSESEESDIKDLLGVG